MEFILPKFKNLRFNFCAFIGSGDVHISAEKDKLETIAQY